MSGLRKGSTRRIECIIKATERCNIDCSYCYFFNKHNKDYERHPPIMKPAVVKDIAQFLAQGAIDLGADQVVIDFHGGEPMLLKKESFINACETFRAIVGPVADLVLKIQTNATLVDQEWLDIFSRYDFVVGVSLDGPPELNDRYRVDHQGRGTYAATAAGWRLLRDAAAAGRIRTPGILCVINPDFNGREVYRHFVDELGARGIDFLLPLETHDTLPGDQIGQFGRFLTEAFDEWTADDNPSIHVRLFRQNMMRLAFGRAGMQRLETDVMRNYCALTISSNGEVNPDDTLRAAHGDWFASGNSVTNISLKDFMALPYMREMSDAFVNLAPACNNCHWSNVCRGGRLVNRHAKESGFANESVICADLRHFYGHMAAYLLNSGLPFERLQEALQPAASRETVHAAAS
ncbi:radical SAM protein [Niveispirillum sp. KHB5.9]|uniref:radical SAM protein n=1 Tax=Niveispirillum sp. KHB5.9 TaxID=3400269 RepID=UPI003A8AD8B5